MKLIIVDDHPLARKGIISILDDNEKFESFIEAKCIDDALLTLEREKAEIVLIDLKLGDEDGLEVVRRGKKTNPSTRFIVITSCMPYEDFQRAEALGVYGYILKSTVPEDISYVVDLVIRGKKYYDPDIISYFKTKNMQHARIEQLTDREKEVLQEIGKGLSNEEIAEHLFISVNTVKKHISSILSKLNLEHRTKLALFINNMEC